MNMSEDAVYVHKIKQRQELKRRYDSMFYRSAEGHDQFLSGLWKALKIRLLTWSKHMNGYNIIFILYRIAVVVQAYDS
jgi:hypothetical protein